jgi:hypothetical protein
MSDPGAIGEHCQQDQHAQPGGGKQQGNQHVWVKASRPGGILPVDVPLIPLPLLQPVQAGLRLYKFVIKESVPPLDDVQTLVEQQPDDVPHRFIGHSIGVKRLRVL